jgi:hypothetical protein
MTCWFVFVIEEVAGPDQQQMITSCSQTPGRC